MEVDKEKDNANTKSGKGFSSWHKKQKIKKLSDFKLTKDDKYLIKATDDELKQMIIKELNTSISKFSDEIEEINTSLKQEKKDKEDEALLAKKKHKKYLIQKIKKLKKCLNDDSGINARVKLLKQKRHKLISKKKKIDESLGNLKNSLKRCLKCKKRGHLAENCPFDTNNNNSSNEDNKDESKPITQKKDNAKICYNCGSTEHGLYNCDKPIDYMNLPYAECFKCGGKGHISANCPQNENGIYIRGGSCFICHGKDHLAKNCTKKQMKEEAFKSKHNKKENKQ